MARTLGGAWLDGQLAGAPPVLAVRTAAFARGAAPVVTPDSLVRASRTALAAAVAGPPDRGTALNLLAADALVTLALAAQVELDPDGLEDFAARVRQALDEVE